MDIRSFFGGSAGSNRKSALSEVRESKGSPPKKAQKTPEKLPKRKAVVDLTNSSSDEENPIPKSLRSEARKATKKKKIVLSSDDDELPPSASQTSQKRPAKRGEKISPVVAKHAKSGGQGQSQSSPAKSPKRGVKRPAKPREETPEKDQEVSDIEDVEDEDYSDFVPAKKSKRGKTPPGQSKLQFAKTKGSEKMGAKGALKQSPKKTVDPIDFFNTFGTSANGEQGAAKTTVKRGKEVESGDVESKKSRSKKPSPEGKKGSVITETRSGAGAKSLQGSPVKRLTSKRTVSDKIEAEDKDGISSRTRDKDDEVIVEDMGKRKTKSPKKPPMAVVEKIIQKDTKRRQESPSPSSSRKATPKKPPASKVSPAKVKETAKRGQKLESISQVTPAIDATRTPPLSDTDSLPWVDKYKPTSLKQLVAQHGEKSPMNKLLGWLRDWPKYHLGEGAKEKRARPPPWMAQSDGTSFKAALLSGPPGIGKTTCAILACNELGLEYIEMNASDARNKKLLDVKVAELLGSRQIVQFFGKSASVSTAKDPTKLTHVLIMDEVDGMSGNEDRAGLAELIQMIKDTKIPVICICNDRQSSKMRTLVNYCFDLRFPRPRIEQIRPRIQTIAFQEKLKLTKEDIDEIIEASNHDVRQTIYNLQLRSYGGSKDIQKKDVAMNTFEAARVLLNAGEGMATKERMFFVDYSIMPLFVQENYPNLVSPKMSKKERIVALRRAAESISTGDLIDRTIRSSGAWSLLKEQALFSSILPSVYMNGYLKSMITFPGWLGKNSSTNKHHRLLRQIEAHTFMKLSSDCRSLVTEYVPLLRSAVSIPLIKKESDGVPEVISVLDEYDLTREDSDEIADLGTWPGMEDYRKKISVKAKSALTRSFNKHSHLLPYAIDEVTKKRGRAAAEPDVEMDEEGNLIEVGGSDELNEDNEKESDDDMVPIVKTKTTTSKPDSGRGGRGGGRSARGARGGAARGDRGRGRGRGR